MKEYEEKYKQIFRYLSLGMSQNEISKLLSTSRNTIRKIKAVTDSIRLSWEDASKMTNEEFVHTIFPKNKNDNEELQPRPDCEMMYKELQKPGVTRTLLWEELYMTGGESHYVRYMRATTKPLVRATSSVKRASPCRLAS